MSVNSSDVFKFLGDEMKLEYRLAMIGILEKADIETNVRILSDNDFAVFSRLQHRFRNSNDKLESNSILSVLINATSACIDLQMRLIENEDFIYELWTNVSEKDKSIEIRKLSLMLFSNLSITEGGCQKTVDIISKRDAEKLVDGLRVICKLILKPNDGSGTKNEEDGGIERENMALRLYAGYVLRNFTQSADIRRSLIMESIDGSKDAKNNFESPAILTLVLPILTKSSDMLKAAVAGMVRNISFDTDLHERLIGLGHDDLLFALLYPLIGGEQFNDEENDSLPIDLQYMDSDKRREPDLKIRMQLLETLYQLCATGNVREYLRIKGTYYVLREYHKWEQQNVANGNQEASKADLLCANVIGVLIRTEAEIGCDNLKSIKDEPS